MALDEKAIVTFGYYPTLVAEINLRVATFGWIGSLFVPPVLGLIDLVRGLSIRLRKRHKL